jgi:hypothetical protein
MARNAHRSVGRRNSAGGVSGILHRQTSELEIERIQANEKTSIAGFRLRREVKTLYTEMSAFFSRTVRATAVRGQANRQHM